ncbi:glycylpeptide N-tetradecanoyltransferase 2 isoform X3 [Phodopus roborovskii]|uniref:glycylpeptide N-tetradecanoyltransferase 2 isoform X3 n=1 Tax=Phodopus roborovskii TaxID=109678 RepID=UPI0021E46E08|nr:glycylpeptide N-tetradecanoyltransferase 2 isoform X3 [Phodopus roborovskii]
MRRRRNTPKEALEGIWEQKRKRRNRREKRRSRILGVPSPTLHLTPRRLKFSSLQNTTPSGSRFQREQPWNPTIPIQKLQDIQRAMELLSACQGPARNIDEATKRRYQFWDTQPVPKLNEVITSHGAIEPDKDNIRQEPYSLPQGFMWDTLDLSNAEVLKELYTLLNENYVEDDDNMFRFDYSPEFLLWALRPPGWLLQWHCGVRVSSNKKLVGFISAIPANIRIYDSVKRMVEINFLCVHKKLRSKRVAPVLIREITRRVNLEGIFQAVYTAGVVLPKPVATCRYWHRSLNPRKLVEVKFSHLSRNMTLQRTMKLYRLPDVTKTSGLRPMEPKDIKAVRELINNYLKQFHLAPVMDEEEVAHWFLPREHIIDTFVVESPSGKLTDFLSFYTLPSTVMHHPAHKSLKAAYSFYNIHTETPLLDLMNDALIIAKLKGFDVFNALDLMENKTFLEKLKFGIGDGNLQYYLYNWRCPGTDSEKCLCSSPEHLLQTV